MIPGHMYFRLYPGQRNRLIETEKNTAQGPLIRGLPMVLPSLGREEKEADVISRDSLSYCIMLH